MVKQITVTIWATKKRIISGRKSDGCVFVQTETLDSRQCRLGSSRDNKSTALQGHLRRKILEKRSPFCQGRMHLAHTFTLPSVNWSTSKKTTVVDLKLHYQPKTEWFIQLIKGKRSNHITELTDLFFRLTTRLWCSNSSNESLSRATPRILTTALIFTDSDVFDKNLSTS